MIHISNLDDVIARQQEKHQFSEHVLRIHLLGYSVSSFIKQSGRGVFTLMMMNSGYYGLIYKELWDNILLQDPFDLEEVEEQDFARLGDIVRCQINWLRKNKYEPRFHYKNISSILHELSFIDSDSVGADDVTFLDHEVVAGNFRVGFDKLSLDSYNKLVDWHLTEFYSRSPYLELSDEALSVFCEETPQTDQILNFTSGYGDILVALSKEGADYVNVDVFAIREMEGFLCEMNLWAAYNNESSVRYSGDVFGELAEVIEDSSDIETAVGFASIKDSFDRESFNALPNFEHIVPPYAEYAEAYIMALIRSVKRGGKVVVAVPIDVLFRPNAKWVRSKLLETYSFKVFEIEQSKCESGDIAILSIDVHDKLSDSIEFIKGDQRIQVPRTSVSDDNSNVDLRPSRFLNTIEYRYRDIFTLFDRGVLDQNTKENLKQILTAIDDERHDLPFNTIRKVMEGIYHRLLLKEPHDSEAQKNPTVFFTPGGGIKLEASRRFFNGESVNDEQSRNTFQRQNGRVIPSEYNPIIIAVQKSTNSNSHFSAVGTNSRNSFNFAAFGLLTLLEWFNAYTQENNQ